MISKATKPIPRPIQIALSKEMPPKMRATSHTRRPKSKAMDMMSKSPPISITCPPRPTGGSSLLEWASNDSSRFLSLELRTCFAMASSIF